MARIKVVSNGKKESKRIQLDGIESTVERMETFIIESDSRRRGRGMKAVSDKASSRSESTRRRNDRGDR